VEFKSRSPITGVATGPDGTIGESKLDIEKKEKP
jgi:hypothetical protein